MTTMTTSTAVTTQQTYATAANAEKALARVCAKLGRKHEDVRWMVGVALDGRFAPVVFGVNDKAGQPNMQFAFNGVMVIG